MTNNQTFPEPATESIYATGRVDDALDKISQIQALARVSSCATDTVMNVDLEKCGYGGVFELIHRLSREIYAEVEEMERKAKVGIYAEATS